MSAPPPPPATSAVPAETGGAVGVSAHEEAEAQMPPAAQGKARKPPGDAAEVDVSAAPSREAEVEVASPAKSAAKAKGAQGKESNGTAKALGAPAAPAAPAGITTVAALSPAGITSRHPAAGTFVYVVNPHYNAPIMADRRSPLNPPLYLGRVMSAPPTAATAENIILQWYVGQNNTVTVERSYDLFSDKNTGKNDKNKDTATNHVFLATGYSWTVPINNTLRIPTGFEPVLLDVTSISLAGTTSSAIAASCTPTSLFSSFGPSCRLPNGWGLAELGKGLPANASLGAPAQQPFLILPALSDQAKSKGGKGSAKIFSKKGKTSQLVGVFQSHAIAKIMGNKSPSNSKIGTGKRWDALLELPTSLGGGKLSLGSYAEQLPAVVAHDQAARFYDVMSQHRDDSNVTKRAARGGRSARSHVVVNFSSDAEARRWSKRNKPKQKRYRGVRELPNGSFMARITVSQRQIKIGEFDTLELAAQAYDQAAIQYQGTGAVLNFPNLNYAPHGPNASTGTKDTLQDHKGNGKLAGHKRRRGDGNGVNVVSEEPAVTPNSGTGKGDNRSSTSLKKTNSHPRLDDHNVLGNNESEESRKKKRGRPSNAKSPDGPIQRFLPSGVRGLDDPLIGVSQASNGFWIARIDMDGGPPRDGTTDGPEGGIGTGVSSTGAGGSAGSAGGGGAGGIVGTVITSKHLGFYETDVRAAEAYDRAAIAIRGGAKAFINFDYSRASNRRGGGRHPSASPTNAHSGGSSGGSSEGASARDSGNGSVTAIMKAAEPALPSGGIKYRGVSFMYKCARWRACLVVKGKPQHLGLFRNAKEAAIAYDTASLCVNGASAVLNFDVDGNRTEHSAPGHGGLYGEHALTTKPIADAAVDVATGSAPNSSSSSASSDGQDSSKKSSGAILVGGVPWPRIGNDHYQVSPERIPPPDLLHTGAASQSSSREGIRTPDKSSALPETEQGRVGLSSTIKDENLKSIKLTTGQNVECIFGHGAVLGVRKGKSGNDCVSIKTDWGIIYASSPGKIGIRAQTGESSNDNGCMDVLEQNEQDHGAALSDDEDKTPKDTHYGTLLKSGRSVDVTTWTPKEKSLFEIAMWECDKDFTEAARIVGTKTYSDCAKFYYCSWKLARSHRRWKQVRLAWLSLFCCKYNACPDLPPHHHLKLHTRPTKNRHVTKCA